MSEINEMFNKFWKAYPKKKDKAGALKEFIKLNPDRGLLNKILKTLEVQKNDIDWVKENRRYMPYGTRYIKYRRWEDLDGENIEPAASESSAFGTFL